jgi:hypothetical protein
MIVPEGIDYPEAAQRAQGHEGNAELRPLEQVVGTDRVTISRVEHLIPQ